MRGRDPSNDCDIERHIISLTSNVVHICMLVITRWYLFQKGRNIIRASIFQSLEFMMVGYIWETWVSNFAGVSTAGDEDTHVFLNLLHVCLFNVSQCVGLCVSVWVCAYGTMMMKTLTTWTGRWSFIVTWVSSGAAPSGHYPLSSGDKSDLATPPLQPLTSQL